LTNEQRVENEKSYDKVYQRVEKDVTREHAALAQQYGQTVNIPELMANFRHVQKDKIRWKINFLEDAVGKEPRIISPEFPELDKNRSLCHAQLWYSGFFVTSGIKYGCDWLAY